MQSPILRIVYVFAYMLSIIAVSSSVSASSDYGPSPDPIIEDFERSTQLFITCPPPTSYSCTSDVIFTTFEQFEAAGGSATIPPECSVNSFSFEGDVFLGGDGCSNSFSRSYKITTDCGSTFECSYIVTLTDTTPPVITDCPDDVTIDASANCMTTYTFEALVADDDCGNPTTTSDAPASFGVGTTEVTFTVTDDCGNSSECSAFVTVNDVTPPTITCPPTLSVQCAASDAVEYTTASAFVAAGGTISDACTTDINLFTITTQNDSSDGGSCPETVTRTYIITDVAGQSALCTQTIIVDDTIDPTFTTPADIAMIACSDLQDTTITGGVSDVMDNCNGSPLVAFSDATTDLGGGMMSILRTFTVTDGCGNTATGTQTIGTTDSTPPVAVCQDITIYIPLSGSIEIDAEDLDGGSTDDCGGTLTFAASKTVAQCNDVTTSPEIVELYVTNSIGLIDTCESTITFLDTITPVITGPSPVTVTCIEDVPAPFENIGDFMVGGGVVVDNCFTSGTFSLMSDITTGVCPQVVTRIYMLVDFAGLQSDTAVQVINVIDIEEPVLTCPANITILETDICDTLLTFMATATDNCSSDQITITNDFDNGDGNLSGRFSGGVTTVQFIATDMCDNADTCTVTVTVAADPKITLPPFAIDNPTTDQPYADFAAFTAAGGSINDNCDIDPNSFSHSFTFEIMESDSCLGTVVETYSFTGLISTELCTETRSTVVTDSEPPVLTCGQTMVFGVQDQNTCMANLNFSPPTVIDNFAVSSVVLNVDDMALGMNSAFWVATDACGNKDSCEIQVTIVDGSSPLFLIDTAKVMCEADIPQYSTLEEFLGATIYNPVVEDCNLDSASFSYLMDTIVDGTPGKLYEIFDLAGNMSTEVHFYVVDDETPPMINSCSANVMVSADTESCDAAVTIPVLDVSDNCGSVTVTNSFNGTDDASGTYPKGTTTVTWTVSDGDQETTCSFTVMVSDDEVPDITCPTATLSSCDISEVPAISTIEGFTMSGGVINDNCEIDSTSLTAVTVLTNATSCPKIYTRTYSIMDKDGNANSCEQTIEIDDTVPTYIPETIEIQNATADITTCVSILSFPAPVAVDECGIDATFNNLQATTDIIDYPFPIGVTDVIFSAQDTCGNVGTFSFQVIVLDEENPNISIPDTTIECTEDIPQFANLVEFLAYDDGAVASDCELDASTFTFVKDTTDMTNGFGKQYAVSDSSGNTSTVIHFIEVNDITPPFAVVPPADITVNAAPGSDSMFVNIPLLEVDDNCDGDPTVISSSTGMPDASAMFPIGTTTVTFTISDGTLTTTVTFTVTVIDMEMPMITCPNDTLLFCEIDGYLASLDYDQFIAIGGSVNDNDEVDESTFMFEATQQVGTSCPELFDVEFFIADINGNRDSCIQIVSVDDTIAPVLDVDVMDTIIFGSSMNDCVAVGVSLTPPTATDDCGIESMDVSYSDPTLNGSVFPVGTTLVTYTFSDSCSNILTREVTVIVEDTVDPVLLDPVDTVRIACNPDQVDTIRTEIDLTNAGGSIFDACGFTIEFDSQTGTDTITRTYVAVDAADNSLDFTQIIILEDGEGPVFDSLPDPIDPIFCGDPLPAQEVLTAADAGSGLLSITMDTSFVTTDICKDREIEYSWTATDSCGNSTTIELSFLIARDSVGPVVLPYPDTVTISNVPGMCFGTTSDLTAPTFVDGCGVIDTVFNNETDTILGKGFTVIEWVAIDSCDNITTVEQTVQVLDVEPPVITCNPLVSVNLTDEASNLVNVSSFLTASSDNCGVTSAMIRRLTPVCGDPLSDTFREVARFCCEEVGDTVMVEVQVMDNQGNLNTCMSRAVITDNLTPTVTFSLPNITLSCGYDLDTTDLSEFGKYVFDIADRDSIKIDDENYPDNNGLAGFDALVNENCTATTRDSIVVDLTSCNVGTVTRFTIITDESGNSSTAQQVITVVDNDPFFINRDDAQDPDDDVIWPATFEWTQCLSPAPDTSIAGAPIILNEDECSMVAVTFSDLAFEIGNGGCAYIRRKWKVIDWCQFDPLQDPNPGEWRYNQDIYVRNVTAPIFDNPTPVDSTVCYFNSTCDQVLLASVSGTDDCTAVDKLGYSWEIDALNDGSINFSGNGNNIDILVPPGTHRVIWTISDLCGNDAQREDLYTVVDCKEPSAICLDGLNISLGTDGTVSTWASDIDKGSVDNCTPIDQLRLSFSSDPTDFGVTFTCDDIGDNDVELWVTDLDGNQNFCVATINIQDNANACGNNRSTTVMGQILTQTGTPLAESQVNLQAAELSDYQMSLDNGSYAFMDIESESNLEVTVEKDDTYLEGVNTLDIAKIQRHILGLETFDSPYKLVAADANGDERVSAVDLLTLRKLILGLIDELPDTEAWKFISKDGLLGGEDDPWPLAEDRIVDFGKYITDGDFVGVKVGDVDNTMDAIINETIDSRSANYLGLIAKDQRYANGQTVDVALDVTKAIALQGMQFTIEYDSDKLRYLGIDSDQIEFAPEHSGQPAKGLITLSWNASKAINIERQSQLLLLQFEAVDAGSLSQTVSITSAVTKAQAYDAEDDVSEIVLDYLDGRSMEINLLQNRPNPFFDETVVEFELPEEMEVSLTIFDMTGKIYWQQDDYYPAGTNTIIVNEELIGMKGVFYMKMDAAEYTEVIKMIKIK